MRLFVVFEGGEGSGKSTQAKLLRSKLLKEGYPAVLTREPGGTPIGNRLRRLIKWDSRITIQTELLFILAARSQLITEIIRPALNNESTVICDRYIYSTLAYQGYGRRMDLHLLTSLCNFVTESLLPQLVVLLDMDPEESLSRLREGRDRFEREGLDFHRRVREGYLKLAAAEPERWLVIDASLSRKEIKDLIWQRVERLVD